MEFLDKLNLKPGAILKIAGLGLIGLIVLIFAFQLIGSSFNSLKDQNVSQGAGGISAPAYDADYEMGMAKTVSSDAMMPELSARNIAPVPQEETVTGNTAEDFEVTTYDGTIETRDLKGACNTIAGLKPKDYVIFENANEYDHGCNYYLKVTREHKDEILGIIESLDPKTLVENTSTVKRQIDDFTSETEILLKKKVTIEATLNDAIASYDEIAKVATQARDAESLARIIDSKINIIERLSQQRISVSEQLDRLSRAKADQLDRLDYVYFQLNIYENKYIDGENLKDSWKEAVKNFVISVNTILQEVSIGLIAVILAILQYALYLFLLLVAAKYGWRLAKYVWMK